MKTTDLMLGSYVKVKPSGMIIKVAAIHQKKVGYHSCQSKLEWVQRDLIEPIPLTPEILEKNGFVYNDLPFAQYWEQFGLMLLPCGKGYSINCGLNISMTINSVHDLQHALKLCCVKKEIVL